MKQVSFLQDFVDTLTIHFVLLLSKRHALYVQLLKFNCLWKLPSPGSQWIGEMLDLLISGTRTSLWKEISKFRKNLGKPALDVGDFGSITVIGGRDIERKDEGDSGESGLFLFPKGRRKEKRRREGQKERSQEEEKAWLRGVKLQ